MPVVILLVSCESSSLKTTTAADGSFTDETTTEVPTPGAEPDRPIDGRAPKLTIDDCIDPDLSKVAKGTRLTLCDGSIGAGTYVEPKVSGAEVCTKDGQTACVTTSRFRSVDTEELSSIVLHPEVVAGVTGSVTLPNADKVLKDSPDFGSATNPLTPAYLPPGVPDLMYSTVNRNIDVTDLTISQERATAALPEGYRLIPKISADTHIADYAGGAAVVCGTSQPTVEERVADCKDKNPGAYWDNKVHAKTGSGSWSLVTFNGTHQVWRDNITRYLWSDRLGVTNWCQAAGVSGGGPFAEDDPSDYCDNSTYQNQVTPESLCTEAAGLSTPSSYDSMKGGMRATATPTSPAVRWRLPAKQDFDWAAMNGALLVLNWNFASSQTNGFLWSSTINHYYAPIAWAYTAYSNGIYGHWRNESTATNAQAVCIGTYSE
jgi:hypothetical protein